MFHLIVNASSYYCDLICLLLLYSFFVLYLIVFTWFVPLASLICIFIAVVSFNCFLPRHHCKWRIYPQWFLQGKIRLKEIGNSITGKKIFHTLQNEIQHWNYNVKWLCCCCGGSDMLWLWWGLECVYLDEEKHPSPRHPPLTAGRGGLKHLRASHELGIVICSVCRTNTDI